MTVGPSFDSGNLQDLAAAADDSVKGALSGGRGLGEFLASIGKLSNAERTVLVEQAIKLLEGFYVHMPLKRAMHAIDPLQRLRLLRQRLPQISSELAFHHEMTAIFTSLRDLHTNYILPAHFATMVAYLPFRIERYFEDGKPQFIVSNVAPGVNHATFIKGVKATYWNGVPMERAAEIAASYHAGSNPAARLARGVDGLTKRAMVISPPPDEEWVVLGYEDSEGRHQEFRADWTISGLPSETEGGESMSLEAASAMGLDLEGDTFRRINKMLFAQNVIAAKRNIDSVKSVARDRALATGDLKSATAGSLEAAAVAAVRGTDSTMPEVFFAQPVNVAGRSFAYIRIRTFNVPNDDSFINELIRLLELPEMPRDGLILDVRDNGGGLIWAGERLLQLLTPKAIEPCRVQFINTPETLKLCSSTAALKRWAPSLSRALETGATFSAGFPITDPARCNDIGQRYYGPVVLITDARCYSTTDIFAAGFQDHKIGTILGVDDNTGAGGANVWTLDLIRQYFAASGVPAPLEPLPKGAGMRVAIRRTLRVGDEAGTELEDLGVRPDKLHRLTRADVLQNNADLIAYAGSILTTKTPKKFEVNVARAEKKLTFELATKGVEYVDVFVGRRPRGSHDVVDDALKFELPESDGFKIAASPTDIELLGYKAGDLVCARRIRV